MSALTDDWPWLPIKKLVSAITPESNLEVIISADS
jgi:hypothetical protein